MRPHAKPAAWWAFRALVRCVDLASVISAVSREGFSKTAGSDDFANFQFRDSMFRSSSSLGVEANSSRVIVGAFGSVMSSP